MAPNLLTPVMLLQKQLVEFGRAFDIMMPKLQAFAKYPGRRGRLRTVEDAQELFICLNSHIAPDRNLGHAVHHLSPPGLRLLQETHVFFLSMSNQIIGDQKDVYCG
jgi:hypothetical protein